MQVEAENPCTIVWFRRDLRLSDNPALSAAASRGGRVLPVFIWAPDEEAPWQPGAASRWWLHQSLQSLSQELARLSITLIIRQGPSLEVLSSLARDTGADAVFWNRCYEPLNQTRDKTLECGLAKLGVGVRTFEGAVLLEPGTVLNKAGRPFQVFSAFWRACQERIDVIPPILAPTRLAPPSVQPRSEPLDALQLQPKVNWASGFHSWWQPGEAGAKREWARFLNEGVNGYDAARELPAVNGTSRLSPHLHFGEISPRQLLSDYREATGASSDGSWRAHRFYVELGWREFAKHLLFHFPNMPQDPLRPAFINFPWRHQTELLKAWQRGETGIPLIDAGMRQLWATGWMHNRVRMITGSFLVKNLQQPWQDGAKWFWDTLVDADLANNSMGWQWVAGCGADAAPFFRVFNPITQGEKFDADGAYIRRWIPELREIPSRWIHRPHLAPSEVLSKAEVRSGRDYPEPIVSLFASRQAALEAFRRIRSTHKS